MTYRSLHTPFRNLQKDVFEREFAHILLGDLDLKAMQEAANTLLEYTDFTSFSRAPFLPC